MTTIPLDIYFLFFFKSSQKIIDSLSKSEKSIAWSLQDNPHRDATLLKTLDSMGNIN